MKKKTIILSESDVLYGNYRTLQRVLGIKKEDKDQGEIIDLWYDCDYVKARDQIGVVVNESFVTMDAGKTTYIITRNDLEQEHEDVLLWWLAGAENDLCISETWTEWANVEEGIAYRGGAGYSYTFYTKSLIK